jgi:hypothetical protein
VPFEGRSTISGLFVILGPVGWHVLCHLRGSCHLEPVHSGYVHFGSKCILLCRDFERLCECDEDEDWEVVWMRVLLVGILRGSVSVTKVNVGCDSERLCDRVTDKVRSGGSV